MSIKYVIEIITPIGIAGIESQPNGLYRCWWGGCAVLGDHKFKSEGEAFDTLKGYVKAKLIHKLEQLELETKGIEKSLSKLREGKLVLGHPA